LNVGGRLRPGRSPVTGLHVTDPGLLAAFGDMAVRVCAYFMATNDWGRAHAWAELAWDLWAEATSDR